MTSVVVVVSFVVYTITVGKTYRQSYKMYNIDYDIIRITINYVQPINCNKIFPL